MKTAFRIGIFVLTLLMAFAVTSCTPVDEDYGVSSETPIVSNDSDDTGSLPTIRSTDGVMPKYVDISQYDEENYANVFLGKRFKFKITYAGTKFTVPTTYKTVTKNGWDLFETAEYDEESSIMAGETARVEFVNSDEIKISAVFYNPSTTSAKLKKCDIVKFIIENNSLFVPESEYGRFNVNSVTNHSAITDVIEALGAPSHFYARSANEYYLDYFISENNRRSGITVFIDPQEDSVTKIEFSNYK